MNDLNVPKALAEEHGEIDGYTFDSVVTEGPPGENKVEGKMTLYGPFGRWRELLKKGDIIPIGVAKSKMFGAEAPVGTDLNEVLAGLRVAAQRFLTRRNEDDNA